MKNKHNFIKGSAIAIAALFMLNMGCNNQQKTEDTSGTTETVAKDDTKSGIGVQIYSVRDALKEDFAGTMKKVGDIGFDYVEGYGMDMDGNIYGMAPEEYSKIVEDSGMKLVSCHVSYFTPEQAPKLIEASKAAGIEYLIVSYLGEEHRSDYRKVAENFNAVGKLFKDAGIEFGYHNHAFEFEKQGDEVPLEILLKETDPELVTFELDLYWVVKGGHDPMRLINEYPGRFSLYHVKDADENLDQTTVGTGTIDFEALLNAKEKAGLEYYFVEDERTDDPFANLRADYEYVSGLK